MKKFIPVLAVLGLVVLTACSGNSPSRPPLPTPAPDTWAITSLSASDANPYVNVGIYLAATVTKNGGAAPDGTWVEFIASPPGLFPAYSSATAQVATAGGQALILLTSSSAASFLVQARVVDAVRQVGVTFREHSPSDNLQIFLPLSPSVGGRRGGEDVTLTGINITTPVEVTFILRSSVDPEVNGHEYLARTVDVTPSGPEGVGTILIETPEMTTILDGQYFDPTLQQNRARICLAYEADVKVEVGVGTSAFQTRTYPEAFTVLEESDPACDPSLVPECPPAPEIYLLVPDHGHPRGGEQVEILGRYFGLYWDDDLRQLQVQTANSVKVEFVAPDRTLRGVDPVVSPDGHQISVTTPRYGAEPLGDDVVAAVKVTSLVNRDATCGTDELSDTKTEAFVFQADQPTPEVLAVAPTAGPVDGGTVVTVFGHGFQFPARVDFGNDTVGFREAIVNDVEDDTTAADNDTILCVTPNFSDVDEVPPFDVDVRVTNIESGKTDSLEGAYTYGAILFISGNTPTEGGRGTVVTLYGNGFEDPLTVDFGGADGIRLQTPQVSGTQIVARFPDDDTPECQDRAGSFTVTLVEQNQSAEGGNFTYRGNNPTVTSVDPPIVQETLGGAGVTPDEVVIHGVNFATEVLVTITGSNVPLPYTLQTNQVSVVSDALLEVVNLPAPNDFDLTWLDSSCITTDGFPGRRRIPTSVDVQVTNIPGNCSDVLVGGLVYNPEVSVCEAVPTLQVLIGGLVVGNGATFALFDETEAGNCSPPQALLVRNNGIGDLNVTSFVLGGDFFLTAGAGQTLAPFTVPQFSTVVYELYFCPAADDQLQHFGALAIVSNDGGQANTLYQANLTGQEGRPLIVTTPGNNGTLNFPTGTVAGSIRIANNGVDDLAWSAVITGANGPHFTLSDPAGTVPPASFFDVTVTYDAGSPVTTDARAEITHDDPRTTTANPILINLTGTP